MNSRSKPSGLSGELRGVLATFRHQMVQVGLLSMLANLLMLAPTLYMLQVYDRVTISRNDLTLIALSMLTLGLFGVMACAEWLRSRILVHAGVRLDRQLSTRTFEASFHSHLSQLVANPGRAFTDLIQLRQFLTGSGLLSLFDLPWAPIYLAVLFLLHPALSWLAIAFALIQLAITWFSHRNAESTVEQVSAAQSQAQHDLQRKLRNAEVVEALGMRPRLQQQWSLHHAHQIAQTDAAAQKTTTTQTITKFVRYTMQSLTLGAGALLVIRGELSPGAMIAANVLMGRALAPFDQVAASWKSFLGARLAYTRLDQLFSQHPNREPGLRQTPPVGHVQCLGVTAFTADRTKAILTDIYLELQPGQVTAVIGPSGSGKTTLAKALMGVWPDIQGQVLLDGIPIQHWHRTDLGPHIGYLPQDIQLFEGTIAENIARLDQVDSTGVILAAQATGLHHAILRFPKGYDTPVGEAGSLLSGGQRQRLGLARALYGSPRLLVLDEPNANLDDVGEAALAAAIQQAKAMGACIVIVSHRPGILSLADQVVALRQGTLVAAGPRQHVLDSLAATTPATGSAPQLR